jgi:hypothetical protein
MIFSILGRKSMACLSRATAPKPHCFMSLQPNWDDPTSSKSAGNGPWFLKTVGKAPHKLVKTFAALVCCSCRSLRLAIKRPKYQTPVCASITNPQLVVSHTALVLLRQFSNMGHSHKSYYQVLNLFTKYSIKLSITH